MVERAATSTEALGIEDVLIREYQQLWGKSDQEPAPENIEGYYAAVHGRSQAALCLSGGGIRSAAFALGVVQALARHDVLGQFQYLSTVSGGGYTGSWLSRWIAEEGHDVEKVADALAPGRPKRKRVEGPPSGTAAPKDASAPEGGGPKRVAGEPVQVAGLRERSNFLTPSTGVASGDSWAALAIVVRNLLLNWLVFVPALMLLPLAFHLYRLLVQAPWTEAAAACIGAFLGVPALGFAVYQACSELPSHRKGVLNGPEVFRRVALPALVWALVLPVALAPFLASGRWTPWDLGVGVGLVALLPVLAGYVLAGVRAKQHRRHFVRNGRVWLFAALVSSAALAGGTGLIAGPFSPAMSLAWEWRLDLLALFGPLWVIVSHVLLSAVFAGFRRVDDAMQGHAAKGGPAEDLTPDLDREWLARLSGLKLRPAVAWGLLGSACVVLPPVLFGPVLSAGGWHAWAGGVVGAASGALAVFGGSSRLAAAGLVPAVKKWGGLSFDAVVGAGTAVFVLALLAGLGWAVGGLAGWIGRTDGAWYTRAAVSRGLLGGYAAVGGALVLAVWLASRHLNVNRFSLHGLYRNRLARAFLGAARGGAARRPAGGEVGRDPFTGFDPGDNIRVEKLWPKAGEPNGPDAEHPRRALFHVINMTLNLAGSGRLAWQERKAEGFTVTPLTCGFGGLPRFAGEPEAVASPGGNHRQAAEEGRYVETAKFAGRDLDRGMEGTGISLATAMAISGAAVSPAQGYNTSPATAFLMSVFNVRLGAWLPNPGRCEPEELMQSKPKNALVPLLRELLGLTNDGSKDIYLTDGGHFENLGLYEMVRRRCRFIVVGDAGCDPKCTFEDLGNAARKILIDQRIRITFDTGIKIVPRGAGKGSVAHAVGRIEYPEHPRPGWLLYVKPSYSDDLPVDIRAYASGSCAFPHETTLDQWFSESQFESYRRLGEEIIDGLVRPPRGGHTEGGDSLEAFFMELVPGGKLPKAALEAAAPVLVHAAK